MKCQACGTEMPEGMAFCGGCGAALAKACARCGFESPPGFRFCGRCGAPLAARGDDPGSVVEFAAERRQLTVMFCDLVESTQLSGHLDPEELRDVVRAYQQACVDTIESVEGHVAQYLGDGLLVYFGFPRAHEDDARRAVLAGLGICEAMTKLNSGFDGREIRLAVRVGIHTGPVVTGDMGSGQRQERLALGKTPNVAARLQGLAEPDTVLLSGATYELVRGFFDCDPLGAQPLKGISEPVEVYRALRPSDVHDRFEAAADRGLTPLVGREQELALLLDRFERAAAGHGQTVLLSGEAGIGKSRLLHELLERLDARAGATQVCHCSAYFQTSAFRPLIALIEERCRFRRDDSPAQKTSRLETFLEPYGLPLDETVPLLANLLSLPVDPRYPAPEGSPQRQKERTLEILFRLLLPPARGGLAVVVVEDLHWADPSTLEFLDRLVGWAPGERLFVVLTSRPGSTSPWRESESFAAIALERLGDSEVQRLIAGLTGGRALPAEVVRQVLQKTDGVPLFVEELTKMVLESDQLEETRSGGYRVASTLPALDIPMTLQDSLMARLDRLSTVKMVAQLGSVLGREFTLKGLTAVSPLNGDVLQRGLDKLVEAGLLFERGTQSEVTYVFKHSLIQDAAYQSLLKSTRQQVHRRYAKILEDEIPAVAETQPELLAYHYAEGGLPAPAVAWWLRAGQRAMARSANLEAIDNCRKGLQLVEKLPEGSARDEQELELLTTLAPALIAIKSYASPEVEQAYSRARELCQQMGQTPKLFLVYWGLFAYYLVRDRLAVALDLAEQLVRLGESLGHQEILASGYAAYGTAHFYRGELAIAEEHLRRALALDSPGRDRSILAVTGQDVGAVGRAFLAMVLWARGYPDQALAVARENIAIARELSHPFSLAFALHFACMVRQFRGEPEDLEVWNRELLALSEEQGFIWWLIVGSMHLGWTQAATADGAEGGLERMQTNMEAYTAAGSLNGRTHIMPLLIESAIRWKCLPQARRALEQVRTALHETGERHYEAELYRLEGELELAGAETGQDGSHYRAEPCFQRGLETARRQGSRSLELRCALSLARLWRSQGRSAEAADLLGPVYAGFTEGFDALDLREARSLLQELKEAGH